MKKSIILFLLLLLSACRSTIDEQISSGEVLPTSTATFLPVTTATIASIKTPEPVTPFSSCKDEEILYTAFPCVKR